MICCFSSSVVAVRYCCLRDCLLASSVVVSVVYSSGSGLCMAGEVELMSEVIPHWSRLM